MFQEKTIYDLLLHECVSVDESLRIRRVPGGWNYEYMVGEHISIQYVPFNKEFLSKGASKPKVLKTKEDVNWDELLVYWNKINAIACKDISDGIKKLYIAREAEYTKSGIIKSIANYGNVINSPTKYFFDTRWNLKTFLKQGNCLPNFLDDGETWVNYKKSQSSPDHNSGIKSQPVVIRTID